LGEMGRSIRLIHAGGISVFGVWGGVWDVYRCCIIGSGEFSIEKLLIKHYSPTIFWFNRFS